MSSNVQKRELFFKQSAQTASIAHHDLSKMLVLTFTVQCMLSFPHSSYCLLAGVILKQPTAPVFSQDPFLVKFCYSHKKNTYYKYYYSI